MRAARALAGVAATAAILAANAAAAHEFTAALYMTGEMREARLAEAVNGFLLAADERDGHSDETSDGHLGGVDVQVLPRAAGCADAPLDITQAGILAEKVASDGMDLLPASGGVHPLECLALVVEVVQVGLRLARQHQQRGLGVGALRGAERRAQLPHGGF